MLSSNYSEWPKAAQDEYHAMKRVINSLDMRHVLNDTPHLENKVNMGVELAESTDAGDGRMFVKLREKLEGIIAAFKAKLESQVH